MTTENFLRCVEYLESWSKKLLSECRRISWNQADFIEANDFSSYLKYFDELIPFFEVFFRDSKNDETKRLIRKCVDYLYSEMQASLKPKFLVTNILFGLLNSAESFQNTNDFELKLNELTNELGNLVYQIRLLQND